MFTTKTIISNVVQINNHYIIAKHIEEIEVDANKVLIHMTSGRKITIDQPNNEKAVVFANEILECLGYTKDD